MPEDKSYEGPTPRQKREPHGYRVAKDIIIGTRSGRIKVQAHKPIRDPYIIGHLKRSGAKLEPFYDD
jgi:hypothetical protein